MNLAAATDTPRGEDAVLVAVQQRIAYRPAGCLSGARALSHFGEHSAGWVGVSLLGALLAAASQARVVGGWCGGIPRPRLLRW